MGFVWVLFVLAQLSRGETAIPQLVPIVDWNQQVQAAKLKFCADSSSVACQAFGLSFLAPRESDMYNMCKNQRLIEDALRTHGQAHLQNTLNSCINAEYRLLYNETADSLAELLYDLGLNPSASIGPAQIKIQTAMEHIEKIHPQSSQWSDAQREAQVAEDLRNPEVAFQYMTLIVSSADKILNTTCQNNPQFANRNGVNYCEKKNQTALLCTLYLIGSPSYRINTHLENGTHPDSNHYGVYAHISRPISHWAQNTKNCHVLPRTTPVKSPFNITGETTCGANEIAIVRLHNGQRPRYIRAKIDGQTLKIRENYRGRFVQTLIDMPSGEVKMANPLSEFKRSYVRNNLASIDPNQIRSEAKKCLVPPTAPVPQQHIGLQ